MANNNCYDEKHFSSTTLSAHMEDYIETISLLTKRNKVVRVKDIAAELGIKMPSVTSALGKLRDEGLILYEKYSYIELTSKGELVAKRVYEKHKTIEEFLSTILLIDKSASSDEACKLEHYLSPETCTQLEKFVVFYKQAAEQKNEWVDELRSRMQQRSLVNYPEGAKIVISDNNSSLTQIEVGTSALIKEIDNENRNVTLLVAGEEVFVGFEDAKLMYGKTV